MRKPLWKFFCRWRSKSPNPPTVDEYFYFHKAFQELPLGYFLTTEELRNFCKLFWMKQESHEEAFDQLYSQFVSFDELTLYIHSLLESSGSPELEDYSGGIPSPAPQKNRKTEESLPKKELLEDSIPEPESNTKYQGYSNTYSQNSEQSDFLHFELPINEDENEVKESQISVFGREHPFKMEDQTIMPFNRRFVAQRLRRAVETSFLEETDEIHLETMIDQYCLQGYIDEIMYRSKDSSHSHIVLLADRFGSMLGYEFIEDQLQLMIKTLPDCTFEHYVFYNVPEWEKETLSYKMRPLHKDETTLPRDATLWNKETWFLIFSDAGAHSGWVNERRMQASLDMWRYFEQFSSYVYWINPVSRSFRKGTTAQRLNFVIPMLYPYQTDWQQFFTQ